MSLSATLPSQFILCPPLDLPLRLNAESGRFGAARTQGTPPPGLCSDHFASVASDGQPGMHRIHEAVDIASTVDAPVYAVYSGEVMAIGTHDLVVAHQGIGQGYASQYVHVNPLPTVEVGKRVLKGEPIALVDDLPRQPHLHLELWHWVDDTPGPKLDDNAVPVDPTRSLYYWERIHRLDWATVGALPPATATALDAGAANPALAAAFAAAGLAVPTSPTITVLAPGCTWRVAGSDLTYLLRAERGAITVFDEAYGSRTVGPVTITRIGLVYRGGYPTFLVEADEVVYGLPLHGVAGDAVLGAGFDEARLIELLQLAHQTPGQHELDVRRSAFWGMDGSVDEFAAVIEGVRLG